MIQAKLIKPQQLTIAEVPKPSPKENEVLVEVNSCGICGSDIHAYYGKHPFISCPVVPGHEFSGTVAEVGEKVEKIKIGERVTVEPSLVCGHCYNCQIGRYNICKELKVIGCQSDGALAEYLSVPEEKIIPLPQELDFESACLIEPLAVAVHAVRKSNFKKGNRVLILGAGSIGLLILQVVKAYGVGWVAISDLLKHRLAMAKELGADDIIDISKRKAADSLREKFEDGPDLIFECVGVETTIREAIEIARKGTIIMMIGVYEKEVSIPLGLVQDRELELLGSLMYGNGDFKEAVRLIVEEKLKVKPLITHRFKLKETKEAYQAIEKENSIKVLIQVKN